MDSRRPGGGQPVDNGRRQHIGGLERGSRGANYQPSGVARAAYLAASNGVPLGNAAATQAAAQDRRYSVAALWSMAAENDVEVDDELTKGESLGQHNRLISSLFNQYDSPTPIA